MKKIEVSEYSVCSCGAITLYTTEEAYSVKKGKLKKFFPDLDLRSLKGKKLQDSCCCDHCVNHYGLDLCGCGSGERFGHCKEGYDACNRPMQVVGEYNCVVGAGSWLAGGI